MPQLTAWRNAVFAAFFAMGFGYASWMARVPHVRDVLDISTGEMGLILLGISIAVKGFVAGEGGDLGTVPWRSLVLLIAAILFFGATVRDLGLVPALFVSVLLAALAGRGVRVLPAVVIAASLTALSVLIFVVALQLRLSLIGPWLGG